MANQKKNIFVKVIACVLVMVLIAPVGVNAAVPETAMPMASDYLMSYTAYICAVGGGDLEIWFRVTGTGTQEYLGVLSILLYESTDNANWYWVETFLDTEYDTMLGTNAWYHMNHVDYQGVAGRYYKAYVQIWGGPAEGGETRYIWTDVEQAT